MPSMYHAPPATSTIATAAITSHSGFKPNIFFSPSSLTVFSLVVSGSLHQPGFARSPAVAASVPPVLAAGDGYDLAQRIVAHFGFRARHEKFCMKQSIGFL